MRDSSISRELSRLVEGRVCVLGVGNRQRRDDGCGSLIAEYLAEQTAMMAIDAGVVPENYLEKIARLEPDTVLIVDAVDFGGAPGEFRILEPEQVKHAGLSTHALSLRMAADFLFARTKASVAFVSIQPADLGDGVGLSAEVAHAVHSIQSLLVAVCGKQEERKN